MIWPPSMLRIHIAPKEGKRIGLWIPLFLLWPLIFVGAMLFPVIARFIPEEHGGVRIRPGVMAGPQLWMAFAASRGMRVDINGGDGKVFVALW